MAHPYPPQEPNNVGPPPTGTPYPSQSVPNALPPSMAGRVTTAPPSRPLLEVRMFWIGLGIVLATVVTIFLYVLLDSDAAVGWAVIGAVGVAIAFGSFANAFTTYHDVGMQWWHWLLVAFGLDVLLRVAARVVDVAGIQLLAGIVAVAGLVALVVGAIIAAVQLSKESAAASVGPLVAPLVGYTADGQPVYGAPVRSQSTNACAILALIFGILGGVLGIVFGHIALSQIIRTGENGRGLAIAGLVLGYLSVLGVIMFVVLAALAAA